MSLQKYVRQLNPRPDAYIPHVDRIQNILFEELSPEAEIQRAI